MAAPPLSVDDFDMVTAIAPDLPHQSNLPTSRRPCTGRSRPHPRGIPSGLPLELPDRLHEPSTDDELWPMSVEIDVTLACLRSHSQGVSDVIGTLDFSSDGAHFATGGIARKVRVYSLRALAERKAELLASLEQKKSRSNDDGREDTEDEADADLDDECCSSGGQYRYRDDRKRRNPSQDFSPSAEGAVPFFVRSSHGGLRRKQKASSTSNLTDFFQQACERSVRGGTLDSDQCASKIICAPAKLSCLQWVPGSKNTIGCGDYDGVFTEWDVETGMCVSERDEHHGQKVWSIRYRKNDPQGMAATASEDGTVKLWVAGSEDVVASMSPSGSLGSALCSVDFSPDGSKIVMAGADASVYLYDLRHMANPMAAMVGHERTVSYTRFLDDAHVVTTSIDSTVKVWDISTAQHTSHGGKMQAPRIRAAATGSHHVNRRNFVGFAVRGDGVIMTGSETNEVVGYQYTGRNLRGVLCVDFRTGEQVSMPPAEVPSPSMRGKPFVSAINWQPSDSGVLGVANSEGTVRLLRLQCGTGLVLPAM